MNNVGLRLSLATTLLISATAAIAQYGWEESFDHNNPGLYTNMNGGPDNFSIENGVAMFSGVEGTYYGRTDLLLPFDPFAYVNMLIEHWGGAIGVGWYSPSQNAGVSGLFEMDALTITVFEHQGFGAPVKLASGPYEVRVVAGFNFQSAPPGGPWGRGGRGPAGQLLASLSPKTCTSSCMAGKPHPGRVAWPMSTRLALPSQARSQHSVLALVTWPCCGDDEDNGE